MMHYQSVSGMLGNPELQIHNCFDTIYMPVVEKLYTKSHFQFLSEIF